MKLAVNNILHDRLRFFVAVAGVAFATFLMLFQGSLLSGFLAAASRLVDSADADLWITGRGVACFDFSSRLASRYRYLAEGIAGVRSTSRICAAMAEYRKRDGSPQMVLLVGADPDAGPRFPLPAAGPLLSAPDPDSVLIDQSSAALLDAENAPADAEINRKRIRVSRYVEGFASFLGSPYVFAAYRDAASHLDVGPEETMHILVRTAPGYPIAGVQRALQRRMPETKVWTKDEFAAESRRYWLSQTGAGNTIVLSALLGFLIGAVVVSQTIYATTMENLEEFATLKALGATNGFVVRIVLMQASVCGIAGSAAGLALALPLLSLARQGISWLHTPAWLPLLTLLLSLLMCSIAAFSAARSALRVEPGRVFRA
jgi:putative ABC transport system permease protein